MIAKANFKLGDASYQFEIDEKDPKETLLQIIALANPPRFCNVCKVLGQKTFYSNKDGKGNIYIKVNCQCGAQAKLGEYKSGGYFWHDFIKYVPEGNANNSEVK